MCVCVNLKLKIAFSSAYGQEEQMQKNVVAGESRSGKVDNSAEDEAYRSTCNVHIVCACMREVVHDSH